MTNNIT